MNTKFYILFSIRTKTGHESFAQFFIGNNRTKAETIFRSLKGTSDVDEGNMLFLDFMETKDDLPVNLKLITCTLNQLAENCKLITREFFKMNNLEEV